MGINQFRLDNKVAVITGGARGIGFASATAMAEAGALVVLCDLDLASTEASAKELQKAGLKADAKQLNVTNPAQVDEVAKQIESQHGKVDVLLNNAGIARNSPALETTNEEWLEVFDINVNGVYWCSRAFGRIMALSKSGSIINIASMSGIIVNKPQPQAAYNASKAAVAHLTKSLAAEWAELGIRVNSISPGYIDTPMTRGGYEKWGPEWMSITPMRRMGNPSEIANLALFLASDASSYMTGSEVVIDGGYTVW